MYEVRAEAFFPLRATTAAADTPRDCASGSCQIVIMEMAA
jgi:hypothetical protein